jgi:predicted phage terminase large subunit-like protein
MTAMSKHEIVIRPQQGPQETFLASSADIAIYGGAAGGGKTWALLLEALRHIGVPGFGAVFFRRNTKQIRNEGGLWDESIKLYPAAGGEPRDSTLDWKFPSGASVSMSHLEHEKTTKDWQGSQIPLIMFDELTHFSESQFFYMLSRNRSMCGVRPYVRASCNPDADSWVARFIAWWIDPNTGYAIPERSGNIRWFVRIGDKIIWADSKRELEGYTMEDEFGDMVPIPPKSVTFVASKLTDNKKLMQADPNYMASLLALPKVERERLLGGNWKIRAAAGLYFNRSWVEVVDVAPACIKKARGWDLAGTTVTEGNDPDATSGTKMGVTADGRYVVYDNVNEHLSPMGVERLVKNTASQDGITTVQDLAQDPGQAGKAQVASYAKLLTGYNCRFSPETGDKIVRFSPFSAQAEAGNVIVVRGEWNERWFSNLEGFPEAAHDDDVDSTSRAFAALSGPSYTLGGIG